MSTATTYERNHEHAGYTIHEARTGWVIEHWSRYQGTSTGDRWLVPYGTLGFQRGEDLDANWNDLYTPGEALWDLVRDHRAYDDTYGIRCLDRGTVLR